MTDFEKWLEKTVNKDKYGNEFWDVYPSDVLKAGFKVFSKQELAELLAEYSYWCIDSEFLPKNKLEYIKIDKTGALRFLKEKEARK